MKFLKFTLFLLFILFTSFSTKAIVITTSCSIAGDTAVCEQEVQSYSSGYSGSYTYLWSAFGGTISGSNTMQNVTVNWGIAGTAQLSVIVKDSLNTVVCTKLITVIIHSLPKPEISSNFTADCRGRKDGAGGNPDGSGVECDKVCDSSWIHYSTPYHSGSTYTWIVNGSLIYTASANDLDVFWTNIGPGSVKVIETNIYGCTAEAELCIEVIEKPTAKFTTLPAALYDTVTICLNQNIYFFNQSTDNGGSPIVSYEWQFGDGNNAFYYPPDSGHTNHDYNLPGFYTAYLVVVNECGCRDTAFITIEVLDEPGPVISCISTVCPDAVMTYSTNVTCPTYNWSTNVNGTIIGSNTSSTVTVQWGSMGPAILTLDVDSCSSLCPVPSSIIVPLIPASANIAGDSLVCEYSCNEYSISCDIPVDSIVWHVPPGLTVIGDTINHHHITICAGAAPLNGIIWVEYFHNTNGSTEGLSCGGNAYLPIHVRPTMYLLGGSDFCENESFSYAISGSSGNISWTITDVTGATTYMSSILPVASPLTGSWLWGPGKFIVTANDLSSKYCNPTVQTTVTVHQSPPSPIIFGPDSVCPNSTHNYAAIISTASKTVSWNCIGGTPPSGVGNSTNISWNPSGPYILYAYELDPITGCKSKADTLIVQSLLPLTPASILGPDSICSSGLGSYTTNSPGDTYSWSINPSSSASISSGQFTNTVQIQANNTTGTVWLVLERGLCNQSRRDSIQITIIPPPSPGISGPATVCQNSSFSISSTSSALSYNWDYGDGNTGTGITANHSYDSSGTFVVTLTVNYGGSCPISAVSTHNITVNPAPVSNISTGDPTLYCTPVSSINVAMTASTSVGTTSCTWYKAPSTTVSTSSTYTATSIGTYFMVCYNAYGCVDTSNYINIDTISCDTCNPQNYSLDFAIYRLGCNTDSFVYTSTNVSAQSWNFGDSYNPGTNSASGNNPTHTYTEPGVYPIQLCGTVPNVTPGEPDCEVCILKSDTINYVPDFYANINCIDYSSAFTVTFVNTTKVFALAPSPSYGWKINGGSILSTSTNYTTSLASGTYTVELIINGVCSIIKTITIDSLPAANFTAADSICEDAPITFMNTSTGSYSLDIWEYGDATTSLNPSPIKVYDNAGLFYASLTIVNDYGCKDSIVKPILVLPNTLSGSISLSGPNEFCQGDSVQLTANVSGGYPAYTYLWNTTASTSSITTYFTGNFGLQVWDSRQCYLSIPDTVVKVHPLPNTTIIGPTELCLYESDQFKVALPNTGFTIDWYVNGTYYGGGNTLYYFASTVTTDTIVVVATNSFGCSNTGQQIIKVHDIPNVAVTSIGSLCAGDTTLLVASSTSTNLISLLWNTASNNDSIYVKAAGVYTATVKDSNGCTASASATVNKLPDMCGLLTGCYEICDTVTSLVWHAPKGYALYQWYYNGIPISGSVYDTLHIPLYQSGTYTVLITNASGCSKMSNPIDITFVQCGGCIIETEIELECGPVDPHGNQSYSLTFIINNPLAAGASIAISSAQGSVTGMSPSTLVAGLNTISATFTDLPAADTLVCFHISIWDEIQRCDTLICDTLPQCKCELNELEIIHEEPFICSGYDGSGNPQYYGCINLVWSGSSSSTLTLVAPNSSFSPNPINIVNGTQTICFTYTDLPPYNPGSVLINAYFYDSLTHLNCQDSFKIQYKECPKECRLDVTGLCAHCEKTDEFGNWVYSIELDVYNPFPGNATVSIIPIPSGTFGPISPNPIPPGTTTISTLFTDLSPHDTIICFRIKLNELSGSAMCYKDICVSLPDCRTVGMTKIQSSEGIGVLVYPNPTARFIYLEIEEEWLNNQLSIEITDLQGKQVQMLELTETASQIDMEGQSSGMYLAILRKNGLQIATHKFVLNRD